MLHELRICSDMSTNPFPGKCVYECYI